MCYSRHLFNIILSCATALHSENYIILLSLYPAA